MGRRKMEPTQEEEVSPAGGKAAATDIDALIADLAEKQRQLGDHLERNDLSDSALAQLFSAYGRNAATLGKLLRDRLALSRKAAEDLSEIINQALDELAKEWGAKL